MTNLQSANISSVVLLIVLLKGKQLNVRMNNFSTSFLNIFYVTMISRIYVTIILFYMNRDSERWSVISVLCSSSAATLWLDRFSADHVSVLTNKQQVINI